MVLPWETDGVNPLLVLLVALLLDVVLGEPKGRLAALHPVAVAGNLIARLQVALNRGSDDQRFWGGALMLMIVGGLALALGAIAAGVLRFVPAGWLLESLLVALLLSAGGLGRAVRAVATPLQGGDLAAARAAVSGLVSRPTAALEPAGIARGALESLGENTSDAVIAPALWFLLLGLPGLALYKAINTADSMVGYGTAAYRAFGRASARLDDFANWPAARLTAGLIAVAAAVTPGADGARAWRIARRDARRHASPNAGWGEAAMAGAVGCACGLQRQGPALFGHELDPACAAHLDLGLAVYRRLIAILASLTLLAWLALISARALAG